MSVFFLEDDLIAKLHLKPNALLHMTITIATNVVFVVITIAVTVVFVVER